MDSNITILLPLLTILLAGLLVSEFFHYIKLPFASALILIGSILGPFGLGYVESNEVITFFGFLGSAFLMFMAGLETDIPALKQSQRKIIILTCLNGCIPFVVGMGIVRYFGYPWVTAFLMGTIFLSSSVAIVFSVVQTMKIKKDIAQLILSTAILEDILSLLIFAVIVQSIAPLTSFPLPIYFVILIISMLGFRFLLPRLAHAFVHKNSMLSLFTKDKHEDRLRLTITVLIAVLLYFSLLGVHPILAAFFAGLLLSQEMMGENIYEKFHTISYGLFVPVFFFIIGMELDLGVLLNTDPKNILIVTIISGLILSKVVSGFVGGRMTGIAKKDALTFGIVTTTQLTTTLAVAYAAFSMNLLDQRLMTSTIVLAVVTNIFVPLSLRLIQRK